MLTTMIKDNDIIIIIIIVAIIITKSKSTHDGHTHTVVNTDNEWSLSNQLLVGSAAEHVNSSLSRYA